MRTGFRGFTLRGEVGRSPWESSRAEHHGQILLVAPGPLGCKCLLVPSSSLVSQAPSVIDLRTLFLQKAKGENYCPAARAPGCRRCRAGVPRTADRTADQEHVDHYGHAVRRNGPWSERLHLLGIISPARPVASVAVY